ncbi:MAG: aminoacyl-tRNA hydrolase [Gammaproteobacteria bacterium]|nr:aminoacyl-tRNA hydrolase [Gammaproteobacteria bacterium]MDE2251862.1 aminoacyl-tRNA hydrolase [Gammaproteobacteria bacterium]
MTGLPLKLVVGLGNPGPEYARTRHNAGFWYVDELARGCGAGWKRETRYQCELARAAVAGRELWLMKPQTFMNRSGAAVQALAAFYRIAPAEMLVVHDDIDLPPGVVRLKEGGGHGGHNGVRDVIAQLGADFWRLRIGVGHPGTKHQVIDAVLDRATAAEQALIDAALQRAQAALPELLCEGAQKAMHRLHTRDEPAAAAGAPGEK